MIKIDFGTINLVEIIGFLGIIVTLYSSHSRFDAINQRLDATNQRLDATIQKFDERSAKADEKFERMFAKADEKFERMMEKIHNIELRNTAKPQSRISKGAPD